VITSQPAPERALSTSEVSRSQDGQQSPVISEDGNDEMLENVIMAIDMKERGTVGCAYYVAREERLFCMEDVVNGGKDLVETCN
jgi:DNA mismatch repair protein MSH5